MGFSVQHCFPLEVSAKHAFVFITCVLLDGSLPFAFLSFCAFGRFDYVFPLPLASVLLVSIVVLLLEGVCFRVCHGPEVPASLFFSGKASFAERNFRKHQFNGPVRRRMAP